MQVNLLVIRAKEELDSRVLLVPTTQQIIIIECKTAKWIKYTHLTIATIKYDYLCENN